MFTQGIAGLAMAFWIAVIVAVVLWAMLRYTVLGQSMTAVGLNETGALFSGMRTRLLKIVAFTLSGLLSSLAGIMIIAQAGSASSTGLGSDLLLPGITAAIVGGTAITGGITNPINVIFGALTVTPDPDRCCGTGHSVRGAEPGLRPGDHHRGGADDQPQACRSREVAPTMARPGAVAGITRICQPKTNGGTP